MKNFLQNLLIFFALCLCGLVAFQWIRETDLRKDVQKLTDTVQDKREAIQNLEAAVKRNPNAGTCEEILNEVYKGSKGKINSKVQAQHD